jgi:hypothetical protein
MSTETAGSGRPGEAEAVFAGLNVMTGGGVSEQDRERWPEVAAIVAAAYPHIARALAEQISDEMEAADSVLCDCDAAQNPPVSPKTKERMAHHCECRAVVASRVLRRGASSTLHGAQCGCEWIYSPAAAGLNTGGTE